MASGSLTTSMARARWGRRRMKPRSSRAVTRRWIPDLDRKSKASFISSNEGGTPVSLRRSLMNMRSSYCLRVSINWVRLFVGCSSTSGISYATLGTNQKHEYMFFLCSARVNLQLKDYGRLVSDSAHSRSKFDGRESSSKFNGLAFPAPGLIQKSHPTQFWTAKPRYTLRSHPRRQGSNKKLLAHDSHSQPLVWPPSAKHLGRHMGAHPLRVRR